MNNLTDKGRLMALFIFMLVTGIFVYGVGRYYKLSFVTYEEPQLMISEKEHEIVGIEKELDAPTFTTEQINQMIFKLDAQDKATAWLQKKQVEVPEEYLLYFQEASETYNVSEELLEAVCWEESRFDPTATCGPCKGLMQVNTKLHAERLAANGGDWTNPRCNIMAGANLIADIADIYGYEDLGAIMTAYHGEKVPDGYSEYTKEVAEIAHNLEALHLK